MPDSTVELLKRAVEAQAKVLDKPKPLREKLEDIEDAGESRNNSSPRRA